MRARRLSVHGLAIALVYPAALAIGLALHVGQPMARRFVAASVNRMLAGLLVGRVTVDRIGSLGLAGLDGVDASVEDAIGRRVLRVRGLRARVGLAALVRSLVTTRRDLVVHVREIEIDRVDVAADVDARGVPRLATALALRPSGDAAPGRVLHLAIDRIDVHHVEVGARPSAPIDGDIHGLHAALRLDGPALDLQIPAGHVVVRLERDGSPAAATGAGALAGAAPGTITADGDLRVSLSSSAQGAVTSHVRWDGSLDAVRETLDVTYAAGKLDAVLDSPRVAPDDLRDLWPMSPIRAPAAVHAEGHGLWPGLEVAAQVDLGAGAMRLSGHVDAGPPVTARLHLDVASFDAGALIDHPLPAALGGAADATVAFEPDGATNATFSIALGAGRWGAVAFPPATATGAIERPAAGLPRGRAEVNVREVGAPVRATVRLEPKGRALALSFDVHATVARLEEVVRLGGVAAGRVDVVAGGTLDVLSGAVDARLSATAGGLRAGALAVEEGSATVHAHGALSEPAFDWGVAGSGLRAGAVRLASWRAAGRGETRGGLVLRDVVADVASGTQRAHLEATVLRARRGDLALEGGRVEGLGAPLVGSIAVTPSRVTAQAVGGGLNLAALASFTDLPVEAGTIALDVDGSVEAGEATGRATIDVKHASLYGVHDLGAELALTLRGRRVFGHAAATVEDIGHVTARSKSLAIGPGPLLSAAPWRKTWGALQLEAQVDLARLAARLPARWLAGARLREVRGRVDARASVERDDAGDTTPDVAVSVRTEGLVLAGGDASGPWRVEGVEPSLKVTVDGRDGATALQADVSDRAGPLVRADVKSTRVPYGALFSDADIVGPLREMPFDARIEVPSRRLDALPRVLAASGGGTLDAQLAWHGALTDPKIDVTARLAEARGDPGLLAQAVDLVVDAHFEGAAWRAKLEATARNARVLDATVDLHARPVDWLDSLGGAPMPWRASAAARVDRLPLRLFGPLYDRDVRGMVTGDLRVDALHDDARAAATLRFDGLEVGGVACPLATASLAVDDRALDASLRIEQSDGHLDGHARAGARWGAALVPTFDPAAPLDVSLGARQFRAAFFRPLLGAWLAELDGRLDADVRVRADGGGAAVRPEGTVAYRDGRFELFSFGTEFHDAAATLTFTPDGLVRLSGATARGVSGVVNAAAAARLDARGLASVRASVRVPPKDPLPLVVDGVQLGQLEGAFEVAVDRAPSETNVVVDVATAHLALPSGPSSLSVQELGAVGAVEVGLRRGPDDFEPVALDAARDESSDPAAPGRTPLKVAVRLGGDVRVRRGSDLDVRLEGTPMAVLTDRAAVTGQIRMPSGTLQVEGRPFEIERGTITFVGDDPANPQVVLTAGWTAPDGTRVYADYVGPLKSAQATLRSSPSRSKNEILALILYGSSDDATTSAAGGAGTDTRFAAAAGEAATQPLNQALGGINRAMESLGLVGGISTKVDTSQANPRPEVELQIARDISLQIAWVLGAVPPGTNPDTTLVTIDWRFLRRWSLETTVGDQGTSILNVVWQARY